MGEPRYNREDYVTGRLSGSWLEQTELHLSELRTRLIISFLVFLLLASVAFYYSEDLVFLFQALAPSDASFIQLKPGELFMSSLKLSVLAALILSAPFILYQVFAFLRPGLKPHEIRILVPLCWLSPLFFYLGLFFAYYLLLPSLLAFLFSFNSTVVTSQYGLEYYLDLSVSMLMLCGLTFQIPILILLLALCGLVNSRQLWSLWRQVVLAAFILGALLTPSPDPLSMSIVAFALIALYLFSLGFLRILRK